MRNNRYTQAVNEIKAPEGAVNKMLEKAKEYEKNEKVVSMKKWIKGWAAASVAVAVTAGTVIGFSLFGNKNDNAFVLKVGAAELIGENTAKIGINENKGLSLSAGDGSIAAYSIGMPMICEGENIDTVTYSVDSGVLVVSAHKEHNPVVDGIKSDDKRTFPYSVNMTEEDRNALNAIIDKESPDGATDEQNAAEDAIYANYTQEIYSSVTFACDEQTPEGSSFCYAGFAEDLNQDDYSYLKAHQDDLYNLYGDETLFEQQIGCLRRLIGRTIHCTVRFKDGSEQTQDVKIGATVSTYSTEYPDEYNSLPDSVKSEKDYKGVFVTYSVSE